MGGDGNATGPIIFEEGRCLVDGPFKDARPLYDNYTANSHCISRGFRNVQTDEVGDLSGKEFGPDAVETVLGQEDFKKFHVKLEETVHDSLHNSIKGDFGSLTSANGVYIPPINENE
jgi:tyrosinase